MKRAPVKAASMRSFALQSAVMIARRSKQKWFSPNKVMGPLLVLFTLLPLTTAWPQAKALTPPSGVVQEGIPPIPASLVGEFLPYRTAPGSSMLGWDPLKPQVIVTGWTMGTRVASRVETPGKPPVMLLKLPDWDREIYMDPGGNYIIYVKPADANFQDQIYRFDKITKVTTLLTDGKSRNRYPVFSRSGKMLAFSSNARDGKNMDVYVVNPRDPQSRRMLIELQGEDWAVFDWSPDDSKVLLSDWKSTSETYLWLFDIKTGKKTLLTPTKGSEKAFNGSSACFSKDGKGIFIISDKESEFRRLAYLDFDSLHRRILSNNIKWDIDEMALSPKGDLIAFISNEDGIGRLHLLNTSTFKEVPVPTMQSGVVSGLSWHRSLPYLGFSFSSTQFPSDVFSINVENGQLEKWTVARNPVKTDEFKEPELIKWKSFDNRTISGFLYRPPDSFAGKRPVIIDIHGGPTAQFRPTYLGEDYYFIHSLGIATIYPNLRGSTGYGKTFMNLDDKFLRGDVTRDIGALLDWITKDPRLDSSRVLLSGISSGGYYALSAAEHFPGRIAAVSAYLAPTNLATFVERNAANDQDGWRKEIGDERDSKMREYLESTSPIAGAARITKPIFLALGGKDLMTSVSETERMVRILKEKGVTVWYLLARDESHNFRDPWIYQYKFSAEALFVKKFLLGE